MKVCSINRKYSIETNKRTYECIVVYDDGVEEVCVFPNYPEGCIVTKINGKFYLEDVDRSAFEKEEDAEKAIVTYRENAEFFYKMEKVIPYEQYEKIARDIENIAKLYKANPYILCEKYDESGNTLAPFLKTDATTNITSFDMRLKELKLMAREILHMNEASGHTWMPYNEFALKFKFLLEKNGHPLFCGEPSAILNYFKEFYVELPLTPHSKVALNGTRKNEYYIESIVRKYANNDGLFRRYRPLANGSSRTTEQDDAVKGAILGRGRFSILTGGPGTGKTTVIRDIVDGMAFAYPNVQIRLLAPTGKAAKRIEEQLGDRDVSISTIHKFLGYGNTFLSKEQIDTVRKSGLVVIDESSMLDLEIFTQLLTQLDMEKTKVILVGDENQLPSIGAGNILHDMIAMSVPTFRLTKNHRNSGMIEKNAKKVIQGKINLEEDEHFKIVSSNAKMGWLFAGVDKENDAIIVPYHNENKKGSVPIINQIAQERRRITSSNRNTKYNVGDVVIATRNNYHSGYLNGDVGKYVGKNGEMHEVKIGNKNVFVLDSDLELGYAITIHKSQGSEYEVMAISIPEYSSFITRKMLYTAITRAKRNIVVYARKPVLDRIILNNKDANRRTFLGTLIT